jgi:putative membrane protein
VIHLLLIPALVQGYIFVLEALLWGKPRTNATFGVKPEQVETLRPWALNQGWYNLFLAVGILLGWLGNQGWLWEPGLGALTGGLLGSPVAAFALASMLAAGLVLVISNPRMFRSALVQIVPALVGVAGLWGAFNVR